MALPAGLCSGLCVSAESGLSGNEIRIAHLPARAFDDGHQTPCLALDDARAEPPNQGSRPLTPLSDAVSTARAPRSPPRLARRAVSADAITAEGVVIERQPGHLVDASIAGHSVRSSPAPLEATVSAALRADRA